MSKKKKKNSHFSAEFLEVKDCCNQSALRLALLSSILNCRYRLASVHGFSRSDLDGELDALVVEQLDCLSDYLSASGSSTLT